VKGTDAQTVSEKLLTIDFKKLLSVETVTFDMSSSMDWIVRQCFPNARKITDRFHVEMLLSEAVQTIRIQYRWEALEEEVKLQKQARETRVSYIPYTYENGDSKKQLLARSRYALFKTENKWSESQKKRMEILFREYPAIKTAYML
jgi:transposase